MFRGTRYGDNSRYEVRGTRYEITPIWPLAPGGAGGILFLLERKDAKTQSLFYRSDSNRIARINMKECPSDRIENRRLRGKANLTNLHKSNNKLDRCHAGKRDLLHWRIGGSVGGDAILCKQSVPRAELPSYARLPVAFPSVATAHRQRIRGRCHARKRDLLH